MAERPNLSSVRVKFNADHLDAVMDKGWHCHTWTVTAWRLAEPWTDGRAMEAALVTFIDAIAPMQRDESRTLPPELWSNEALARAVLTIGNVVRVDVEHGGFGAEVWA